MNFDRNYDVISVLARERQQAMIDEAAHRRLIRRTRRAHPSSGRLYRLFRHDPAS